MKTKTIGELLREARLAGGYDIPTLAAVTRIPQSHLEALERNDFAALPAAVFVKGFISSYARVLELDAQALLAVLRRDYKQGPLGVLQPQAYLVVPTQISRIPRTVRSVAVGVGVVGVVLALYVVWQWQVLNRPPSLTVVTPTELQEVGSQLTVTGRTEDDVRIVVNGQQASLKSDGLFVAEVVLPKVGIATVVVEATDPKGKTTTVQRQVRVMEK